MKHSIITISRQFGSGGRSIAKAVADAFQIPYYDKELIKAVAEKTGFDPAYIEEAGEYAKSKSIFSYSLPMNSSIVSGGLSTSDFLWIMQRQVILEIAEKGPCVILGRCADYILKDNKDALHVFVYADKDYRSNRIVRLYGESEKTPEQRLNDKDSRRAINYKHYTGRTWGMPDNYDLCLNSGKIGEEGVIQSIIDICK